MFQELTSQPMTQVGITENYQSQAGRPEPLLVNELTELEQESLVGGDASGMLNIVFLQNTHIRTFGFSRTSLRSGRGGDSFRGSSTQRTGYELDQTTFLSLSMPVSALGTRSGWLFLTSLFQSLPRWRF
jgi:hypothetical protein